MQRHKDVLVPFTTNPLEFYLLFLCVLGGVMGFTMAPPHPALALFDWCWFGLIVAGGLGGMAAALIKDAIVSMLTFRAALIPLGFGAYTYSAVLAYVHAPMAALVVALFGGAAHLRVIQLSRLMRAGRW